jgi:hypothetical protein
MVRVGYCAAHRFGGQEKRIGTLVGMRLNEVLQ